MQITFHARDPLDRKIVCLRETWFGHIIREHPSLRDRERDLVAGLASPLRITQSDRVQRFWLAAPVDLPDESRWIVVVVRFHTNSPRRGQVQTIYSTKRWQTQEKQVWP